MEKFDVVVIGAGPGGYPAAIRAAQLGASVAIVEKEQIGGTCLNWGCIPTKTLIASSEIYHHMKEASAFGLKADNVGFDYGAMARRKDDVVGKLRGGVGMLLKGNKVTVLEGAASFAGRNKIVVKGAQGETTIEAKNTIIASGSVSAMPGFIPKHQRVVESRAFLALNQLPASMIVLGGGVIGCELACMAAQLGVKVTVVEMLSDVLLIVDAECRKELCNYMRDKLGIRIITGAPLENIQANDGSVSGTVGGERIESEMLLASVGRKPYTEGLGLENVGIKTAKSGHIEVDACGRTAAANIFAIGDVTLAGPQLAHSATSQGVIAAENAVKGKRVKLDTLVPSCIFTVPEIGNVGLTEEQAKEKGIAVKIGKYHFAGLGKSMAAGNTVGFVKWVVRADNDQLIGAHAVGLHATELISEATVAIKQELTAKEVGNVIHCHPTLSESWMEAAHAVHGECIHQPPRRR